MMIGRSREESCREPRVGCSLSILFVTSGCDSFFFAILLSWSTGDLDLLGRQVVLGFLRFLLLLRLFFLLLLLLGAVLTVFGDLAWRLGLISLELLLRRGLV
jgi:hypothetical protein